MTITARRAAVTTSTTPNQKKVQRRYGPPPPPNDPWTPPQGDKVKVPPLNAKQAPVRGPPDQPSLPGERTPYTEVVRQAFTLREFAAAHRLSLRMYYKLIKQAWGQTRLRSAGEC